MSGKTISIYIDDDMHDKLKKEAEGGDRSVSYMIQEILKKHYSRKVK